MIILKKLSANDGMDIFLLLKEIGEYENSFYNPVACMDFEQFKKWLVIQEQWSQSINLPEHYVGQTIFWLYDGDNPVGVGKIRNELTDESRKKGGNIGFAISRKNRNKGYGKILLSLLLKEAKKMNVEEILITIDKFNYASKKVTEECGGVCIKESEDIWYYSVL